jgi:hypothetical protein
MAAIQQSWPSSTLQRAATISYTLVDEVGVGAGTSTQRFRVHPPACASWLPPTNHRVSCPHCPLPHTPAQVHSLVDSDAGDRLPSDTKARLSPARKRVAVCGLILFGTLISTLGKLGELATPAGVVCVSARLRLLSRLIGDSAVLTCTRTRTRTCTYTCCCRPAYEVYAVGRDGSSKPFEKPWCMVLLMFVGERRS